MTDLEEKVKLLSKELEDWRAKAKEASESFKVAQADIDLQAFLRQSTQEKMDLQLWEIQDLHGRLQARYDELTRALTDQTKLTRKLEQSRSY